MINVQNKKCKEILHLCKKSLHLPALRRNIIPVAILMNGAPVTGNPVRMINIYVFLGRILPHDVDVT